MRSSDSSGRNTGAYAGGDWAAYRYGEKRPVYHPAKPAKRALLGEGQRARLVDSLVDFMSDWTASPFEHEASCRHGLRQSFCLERAAWKLADETAAALVEAVFERLQVKRPSWAAGQPERPLGEGDCLHCGAPIDAAAGLNKRFCSPECAKAEFERRAFANRTQRSKDYAAVYRALRQSRTSPKVCERCGRSFHPVPGAPGKYCSRKCTDLARADSQAHLAVCPICGRDFEARHKNALTCGRACAVLAMRLRKGWRPVRFSPIAFDFSVAGLPLPARGVGGPRRLAA
jgi:hypothetical protein